MTSAQAPWAVEARVEELHVSVTGTRKGKILESNQISSSLRVEWNFSERNSDQPAGPTRFYQEERSV